MDEALGRGRWGDSFYVCKSKSKCDVLDQPRTGLLLGSVEVPSSSLQARHGAITTQRSQPPAQVSLRPIEPTSPSAASCRGTSFNDQAREATAPCHSSLYSSRERTDSLVVLPRSILWWAVTGARRHRFTNIRLRLNAHASGGNRCSPTTGFSVFPIAYSMPGTSSSDRAPQLSLTPHACPLATLPDSLTLIRHPALLLKLGIPYVPALHENPFSLTKLMLYHFKIGEGRLAGSASKAANCWFQLRSGSQGHACAPHAAESA